MNSFGVYIHWPFCAQKCPYCDFNSHVRHKGWDEARFLAAYKRELDYVATSPSSRPYGERARVRGGHESEQAAAPHPSPLPMQGQSTGRGNSRTVSSIFFGGGTPSLMKPETVGAILDHIGKLWAIDKNCEVTIEANPGSVEATRFRGYRAAGINRVSMGLQSLRDDDLKKLGRIHTVEESKAALIIARNTFERFSFDLIYARPGQQPDDWRAELAEALDLADGHISLYQLTIEPDTPYATLHAAGKLVVPDPDAALALYEITQERTQARGLAAYEISNHARPGEESRHNLLYWRYGEYAGVGPGAHGRLLVPSHAGGNRAARANGAVLESPSPLAGEGHAGSMPPAWGGGCSQTAPSVHHPHPNPPPLRGRERTLPSSRLATVTEKNPESWLARVEEHGHGFTEQTNLSRAEQADEMLLMGLRLREGIDLDRMAALGGVRPSTSALDHLEGLGLIERGNRRRSSSGPVGNWRANELDPIPMCTGPGLAPDQLPSEGVGHNAPPALVRATPKGRFVLNGIVSELSKSFEPAT